MIKGSNSKNLIAPFIKLKSVKKRQDSFRVCSFYIHGKSHTEKCASKKRKVEAWCQYHIRSDKRWKICRQQYTYFSSLMRSDMKNINRKVLWGFCMSRMFETLLQEKKFKMILPGLSENNCREYWFGSMWGMIKMESFKLHMP